MTEIPDDPFSLLIGLDYVASKIRSDWGSRVLQRPQRRGVAKRAF